MIPLGCSGWPWDWLDCISESLGAAVDLAVGGVFGVVFEAFEDVIVKAVEAVLKAVGTLWIDINVPPIGDADGKPIGTVAFIQTQTHWILIAAATIAVIIAGIQMAVSQRGEPLRDVLKSLLTMAVVSGAGVAFASTLIEVSDSFSQWIIDEAIEDSTFAEKLTKLMDPVGDGGLGLILTIVIGITIVSVSLIQLGLMVVRYGMLVLLVGMLPLTAAATNTEVGMAWFKRAVGWLAAFILYKPIAAIIYASAIKLIGAPSGAPTMTVLTGVAMMLMAVVALPALLRFVSPKTGS
jgi:hypothetical protein